MNLNITASQWIEKAHDDIRWAQASFDGNVWHGACFSTQQAVEKALKAYLMAHNQHPRKIHDLSALLELCIAFDPTLESIRELLLPLVDYYLQTRYPDMGDFVDYTKQKAHDAIDNATQIVAAIASRISSL